MNTIYLILAKVHLDETSIVGSYQTEELACKDLVNIYGTDDYYVLSVPYHVSDKTVCTDSDDAKTSNTAAIVTGITEAIDSVAWLAFFAFLVYIYK